MIDDFEIPTVLDLGSPETRHNAGLCDPRVTPPVGTHFFPLACDFVIPEPPRRWLCSNCKIAYEADEATGTMVWVPKGNSSEAPISVAAGKLKFWTPDGKKDDSKLNPRQLEIPSPSAQVGERTKLTSRCL